MTKQFSNKISQIDKDPEDGQQTEIDLNILN